MVSDGKFLTGTYFVGQKNFPKIDNLWIHSPDLDIFTTTKIQLQEYFNGKRRSFDINYHLTGTILQKTVWVALSKIAIGRSVPTPRKHPNKSKTWIVKKYFSREGNNNWKFTGTKITAKGQTKRLVLESMSLTPIRRHKKIIGKATPYDPTYAEYFKKRKTKKSRNTWIVMPITA